MQTIRFYEQDGRVKDEIELTFQNLYDALGMMTRCYLKGGSYRDGFVCFAPGIDVDNQEKDYGSTFFLWTWANLDEKTRMLVGDGESMYDQKYEPINFSEVEQVDAILFSNPSWGCGLYNHFFIDTRPYLAFEDVQHVFKSIWCDGREEFWYRNVWNILNNREMTRYKTEKERYEVLLRAVAVSMIYEDFCKVYCEELPSYEYQDELADDISDIVLGQLYSEKYPGKIEESQSAAIYALANELRNEVVSAIRSEMIDGDIYAHLVCTCEALTELDDDGDEVDFEIETFDDYKKATNLFWETLGDGVKPNEVETFSWIAKGMLRLYTF